MTSIRPPGGIRNRNPIKRAAADPRLRPRGHWDRRLGSLADTNRGSGIYTVLEECKKLLLPDVMISGHKRVYKERAQLRIEPAHSRLQRLGTLVL
jgi:hypothetical protein